MIGGASAVALIGNERCCVKGRSKLRDVTNDANEVSVLGDIFCAVSAGPGLRA